MYIRRFKEEDAEIVSKLVGRNLLEVNIKDYPKEDMIEFADYYNPETIKKLLLKDICILPVKMKKLSAVVLLQL